MGFKNISRWMVVFSIILSTATVYGTQKGKIVGWGDQVVGANLNYGFVAIAAGNQHSLGLKSDGSIVAWGKNSSGQCNVPLPSSGFTAIAAGGCSLGLCRSRTAVL